MGKTKPGGGLGRKPGSPSFMCSKIKLGTRHIPLLSTKLLTWFTLHSSLHTPIALRSVNSLSTTSEISWRLSVKMHSNHLLLEEPIRMASILEPSKAVSPVNFNSWIPSLFFSLIFVFTHVIIRDIYVYVLLPISDLRFSERIRVFVLRICSLSSPRWLKSLEL